MTIPVDRRLAARAVRFEYDEQ
jgi:hypothetical protein